MDENEKYVRSEWENIVFAKAERTHPAKDGTWTDFNVYESHRLIACATTEAEAWAAARAFTENRLKQIAEIEEEIELIRPALEFLDGHVDVFARIIARLQRECATLAKGMRGSK